MYKHSVAVEVGPWYRVDSASGSDTPVTVQQLDGVTAVPNHFGGSGSTVGATSARGNAEFTSSTQTLYLKRLTYKGAVAGDTPITSTGRDVTPPSGPTSPSDLFARKSTLLANVRDYGAVGDGAADDTPAFQAALDAAQTVYVPAGRYRLATPIKFISGYQLIGEGSRRLMNGNTGQNAAILEPVTCAITMASPTTQYVGATIEGLSFQGGTTQVDLALCHEVSVRGCEFRGFTVAGLCLVRGEKNSLNRLRFDFTVNAPYGIAFGYEASIYYTGGLYAGNNPSTYFGSPDAWVDRIDISNVAFQSGTGTSWTTAAINARILSGCTLSVVTFHGAGSAAASGKLVNVSVRLQTSKFSTHTVDSINTGGAGAVGYDVAEANTCEFANISTSFAGNNAFSRSFNIALGYTLTFSGCGADGDNSSTYGFYFGGGVGQTVAMVGCTGAIYSAGANSLVKAQIALIGCAFSTTNVVTSGSSQVICRVNDGTNVTHMADQNGSIASTAEDTWTWATGSGGTIVPFRLGAGGPKIANGRSLAFDNAFGSGSPQTIVVSNGTPEGSVTAISGSVCLSYTGTTVGALYVKMTGNGNTGWLKVFTVPATTPTVAAAATDAATTQTLANDLRSKLITLGLVQ